MPIQILGRVYEAEIWLTDGGRFRASTSTQMGEAWTYDGAIEELEKIIRGHNPISQTFPAVERKNDKPLSHRQGS